MRRRSIEITAAVLGVLQLTAITVTLFHIAGILGIPELIGAAVAQIAVFMLMGAVFLVTNTRRPYGIDPNAAYYRQRETDRAFASPTADLFRHRVKIQLPDGKGYGNRAKDDPEVVERLLGALTPEAQPMPNWAAALKPKDMPDEIVRPSRLELNLEDPPELQPSESEEVR